MTREQGSRRLRQLLTRIWPRNPWARAGVIAAATLVLSTVLLLSLYAAGIMQSPRLDALFGGEHESGSVTILEPQGREVVSPGTTIEGTYDGEGTVYLWVVGVNHAVPTNSMDGVWHYQYDGGIQGVRTIGVALHTPHGWGSPATKQFDFTPDRSESPEDLLTDDWAKPLRVVFQPIEKAVRAGISLTAHAVSAATSLVTGRGSGDLDSDGVPDRWQGSTLSPTSTWHVPYTSLVFGVVALATIAAATYLLQAKALNAIWQQRQEHRHRERLESSKSHTRIREAELQSQRHGLNLRADLLQRKMGIMERLGLRKIQAAERLQEKKIDALRGRDP